MPALTAEILSMCMALGWYERILHPPPNETLLRGIKIKNEDELRKVFSMEPDYKVKEEGSLNFEERLIIPTENGHSTSWSSKKSVTTEFSEKGKKGFSVTLYADVKDNPYRFLAGPGGLYDVDGLSKYHLEKETVGLEPIKIRKIKWKKL